MKPRFILISQCPTSCTYSRNRQPHQHSHTTELVGSTNKYLAGDLQTHPLRNKHFSTCNLHRMLLVGEYPSFSCSSCWMRIRRYLRELYDQPKVTLSLKTRMVKAKAIEALWYGCSTWTLRQEHCVKLHTTTVHHRALLRIIGAQRNRPDHRMTSYNRALEIIGCESIETTLRTKILFLWAGTLL